LLAQPLADVAWGFEDDVGGEGGATDAPTTFAGVSNFRRSQVVYAGQTMPRNLSWRPVDASKWFYTFLPSSAGDYRLAVPATLWAYYGGTTSIPSVNVRFHYVVQFSGAIQSN
jgi:hypothetical protein